MSVIIKGRVQRKFKLILDFFFDLGCMEGLHRSWYPISVSFYVHPEPQGEMLFTPTFNVRICSPSDRLRDPLRGRFLLFPGAIFGPSKHIEIKSSIKFFFDKSYKCPFKSLLLNFGDPTSLSFVAFDQNSNPPLRKRSNRKPTTHFLVQLARQASLSLWYLWPVSTSQQHIKGS